jgi:hypothetical protein
MHSMFVPHFILNSTTASNSPLKPKDGLNGPPVGWIGHFLFIQTRQVSGPASLLVMGRPASLRVSLI